MNTVRLNKSIRESLVKAVVAAALGEKEKELEVAKRQLAEDVYNSMYPPKVQEAMVKLQQMSNNCAFNSYDSFPWSHTPHFNGRTSQGTLVKFLDGKLKLFMAKTTDTRRYFSIDHPLTAKFMDLYADLGKLREDKKTLARKTRAVVGAVTTTKRLLEVWPECEPYLTEILGAAAAPVPAIQSTELNELISKLKGKEGNKDNE